MGQDVYRALIVDDEPLIREATTRAMSQCGFSCDMAADGRQALMHYHKHCHDLVVTDLRMPEKNGHSLVVELLNEPEKPRIVVLTGVADERLVKDLLGRGVDDIVMKPIDFSVFATKMLLMFKRHQWDNAQSQSQTSSSIHKTVVKIEEELELFSLCIPPVLDRALSTVDDSIDNPPDTTNAFMKRLLAKRFDGAERRGAPRVAIFSTATAVPVNKDFVPLDEGMKMTIYNVSETGASVVHTRAITAEYLALRWRSTISSTTHLQAVVQISRCDPLGPFYEIAGQFVMHD